MTTNSNNKGERVFQRFTDVERAGERWVPGTLQLAQAAGVVLRKRQSITRAGLCALLCLPRRAWVGVELLFEGVFEGKQV